MFGQVKHLATKCTSLRHEDVIPQIMTRLKAKEALREDEEYAAKQEVQISKESKRVKKLGPTIFDWELLQHNKLVQSHLERICGLHL